MITLSLLIYDLILYIIKPYESHTTAAELRFYCPSLPTALHTTVQVPPFLPSCTMSFGHSPDRESSELSKGIPCGWVPRSVPPPSVGIHPPTSKRSHPPVFLTCFHNLFLFLFFSVSTLAPLFLSPICPNYFFFPYWSQFCYIHIQNCHT